MKVDCNSIGFSFSNKSLFSNLNLIVESGEHLWIKGKSGSGKSSFLKILAGLYRPNKGSLTIDDFQLTTLSDWQLREFRLNFAGYVHQENHFIDHWTVDQNLSLLKNNKENIESILEDLNLPKEILNKEMAQLSGGERQRVSLARVLIQKPKLALIDEPTAHLDDLNTNCCLENLLKGLKGTTIILVSHDHRLENFAFKPLDFVELISQ